MKDRKIVLRLQAWVNLFQNWNDFRSQNTRDKNLCEVAALLGMCILIKGSVS